MLVTDIICHCLFERHCSTIVQGAQSVLTQHKPLLAQTIASVNAQTIKASDFPMVEGDPKKI